MVAEALLRGCPEVFNTDQGSQYTTDIFTDPLLKLGIEVSMDGRGRALDNIFVERSFKLSAFFFEHRFFVDSVKCHFPIRTIPDTFLGILCHVLETGVPSEYLLICLPYKSLSMLVRKRVLQCYMELYCYMEANHGQ